MLAVEADPFLGRFLFDVDDLGLVTRPDMRVRSRPQFRALTLAPIEEELAVEVEMARDEGRCGPATIDFEVQLAFNRFYRPRKDDRFEAAARKAQATLADGLAFTDQADRDLGIGF